VAVKAKSDAKSAGSRIEILDFLRGMASLSVALFHFCNILSPGTLLSISQYGKFGVQVFFVISGFVIPYSLFRGQYNIRYYPTFILKRLIRLDPPYLVTIGIILVLGWLSLLLPYAKNGEFHVTPVQVLLHLGYLNTFFGYEWLNDVFWTLAIEFQYYLLMGLVFPVIFSRNPAIRLASLAALGLMSLVVTSGVFVFAYIFLFLMGIVTCQQRVGLIGKKQYALLLGLLLVFTFFANGVPTLVAGSLAVFSMLFLSFRNAIFTFLGNISYSLYLLHSPIGRRALNIGIRLAHPETEAAKLAVIVMATAVSLLAAYILYRLVEKPAQEWSAAFQYKRKIKSPERLSSEEMQELNPAL
jgi:peptidoglycan/LPS O-acetylase OafA/YrhL